MKHDKVEEDCSHSQLKSSLYFYPLSLITVTRFISKIPLLGFFYTSMNFSAPKSSKKN